VFSKEKSLLKSELLKNFLYEPTLGQYELIEKLCDFIFCTEQNPVFILKGYAGTGKTSIIGALTKSLPTVKQRTLLLAPTGRASKVLGKSSNKAAFTIHKKIYKAAETESGGPYFMLQNNSFVNTLIIVDVGFERIPVLISYKNDVSPFEFNVSNVLYFIILSSNGNTLIFDDK
jgi:exodeoxyribonuclease-5